MRLNSLHATLHLSANKKRESRESSAPIFLVKSRMNTNWQCSCGKVFRTLLDLAAHNEETGHLQNNSHIRRVPPAPKGLVTEPPKEKIVVKRSAEIDGFVFEKYYVK